jgi:hypothetical protein
VNQDLSVKVLKATDMGREGEFVFLLPWMKNDEWGEEEWRLGLGLEEGSQRVGRGVRRLGENVGWCDGVVDFAAVSAVVDATHRYKEIFYSDWGSWGMGDGY